MRFRIKEAIFTLFILLVTAACKKDPPAPGNKDDKNPPPSSSSTNGVYILNEGNFNMGNASLSYFDRQKREVHHNVFEKKNGRPLGDVLQSVTVYRDKAYLVINNSGKVEVMDPETRRSLGVIRGLPSPRYLLPVDGSRAYVSNFTLGEKSRISIVDLDAMQIIDSVKTGGWTEAMVKSGDKVFIASVKRARILVVNNKQNRITDSIQVIKEPNSMVLDNNGDLWILCDGGFDDRQPVLFRIDTRTLKIEQKFTFSDIKESPKFLQTNDSRDTLYFLNNGIYRMGAGAGTLPGNVLVKPGSKNFRGLGVHPQNGRIYVTDAVDYVQQGYVFRYRAKDGSLIDSFRAGIIPRAFWFEK